MRLKRFCSAMIRRGRSGCQSLNSLTPAALLARWRRVVFASLTAALVTAAVWRIAEQRRGSMFPKVACPEYASVAVAHRQRVPIGNWSFQAPASMARACGGDSGGARPLLAIVPVTLAMTAERDTLRLTWGSQLNAKFGQLLFLVQLPLGKPVDVALEAEFHRHQDILLAFYSGENSEDTYGLLVRKIVAGLRWYATSCWSGFDYVLKADHDSYWNVPSLLRLLQRHRPSEPLVLGSVQEGAPVMRDEGSKFFTPLELFPRTQFPPYASGGPGYALSRAAAVAITEVASRASQGGVLWLEDVYVTGLLPELAFPPCVNRTEVSDKSGRPGGQFLYLHSDYIFLCRYVDFTLAVVQDWPPLAMHRVHGRTLRKLHAWMQAPEIAEKSSRQHSIVYSRSSCPESAVSK